MTNADYIRSMDDKTLAKFVMFCQGCGANNIGVHYFSLEDFNECCDVDTPKILQSATYSWLKSEVEL